MTPAPSRLSYETVQTRGLLQYESLEVPKTRLGYHSFDWLLSYSAICPVFSDLGGGLRTYLPFAAVRRINVILNNVGATRALQPHLPDGHDRLADIVAPHATRLQMIPASRDEFLQEDVQGTLALSGPTSLTYDDTTAPTLTTSLLARLVATGWPMGA